MGQTTHETDGGVLMLSDVASNTVGEDGSVRVEGFVIVPTHIDGRYAVCPEGRLEAFAHVHSSEFSSGEEVRNRLLTFRQAWRRLTVEERERRVGPPLEIDTDGSSGGASAGGHTEADD